MSRPFGIAGVQMSVIPWDEDATIAKMELIVHEISRHTPWAQMIVFHELAAHGFASFMNGEDGKRQINIRPIPNTITDKMCEIAKNENKWLLPGSLLEKSEDKVYNTAFVISPEGKIITQYRKMFPWYPYEKGINAGDQACVFDIPNIGRFGLCICYDMWFPEVVRTLVWMGAEVIIHPTFTTTPDRALEVILSQSNAIMNQCYFFDINACGPFTTGNSLIVDPDGRVLQQAGENETILSEIIDLDRVRHTREYGTLGLSQTLKQLRDSSHHFPIYEQGIESGPGFSQLGPLQFHREL